jgi:hypothetical protein
MQNQEDTILLKMQIQEKKNKEKELQRELNYRLKESLKKNIEEKFNNRISQIHQEAQLQKVQKMVIF